MVFLKTFFEGNIKKIKIILHMRKESLLIITIDEQLYETHALLQWRRVGAFPTLNFGTYLRTLFLTSQNSRLWKFICGN